MSPRRVRKAAPSSQYGHGVVMSTRISPEVARSISKLVQSEQWDYENNGDFIRAAILHEAERCELQEPGISEWHYIRLIEDRIHREQEKLRFEAIIAEVRGHVSERPALRDRGVRAPQRHG